LIILLNKGFKFNKKGAFPKTPSFLYSAINYDFNLSSDETVSLFLPLALRDARTLLPLGEDILSLNPCLFALFLLDG